eukprot:6108858-Prymnesium_polylepis.1
MYSISLPLRAVTCRISAPPIMVATTRITGSDARWIALVAPAVCRPDRGRRERKNDAASAAESQPHVSSESDAALGGPRICSAARRGISLMQSAAD